MGCAHEPVALAAARAELILASRLAGIAAPLDGVTVEFNDLARVNAEALHSRTLGFGGKLCIHPSQLAPVRSAFTYSSQEIAWAKSVLAMSADGVQSLDGLMVDAPVRALARQVLEKSTKGRL